MHRHAPPSVSSLFLVVRNGGGMVKRTSVRSDGQVAGFGVFTEGLVAQGLLGVAAGYRNGFAKSMPEKEVQGFAESYASTSVLGGRFRLNSGALARHLKGPAHR